MPPGLSRRGFLSGTLGAAALLAGGGLKELLAQSPGPMAGAQFVAGLDFKPEPTDLPLGTKIASGLDARYLLDLSSLKAESLLTSPEDFYVRTACPDRLDPRRPWSLSLEGLVNRATILSTAELEPMVREQGLHLLECAGNSRYVRYGLISVGQWRGIPLAEILQRARARRGASWIRISGFDDHTQGSTNSVAGCSWIFERQRLEEAGAFLATHLGGKPLSADHGFPFRLVVPGWYGCCAIKWVERIEWIDGGQASTTQMLEFASRTHQEGLPQRAAEYQPAIVKMSALPIRVEQWRREDGLVYRIVGLAWGGEKSSSRLGIRFTPEEPFVPVSQPPQEGVRGSWVLWSHEWRPSKPGRYLIQPMIEDENLRSPRMALGHYWRGVEIEEV